VKKISKKKFGGKEKVFTFALPNGNERVLNRRRNREKSSLKILETVLNKARNLLSRKSNHFFSRRIR
jgi:hypothetical protein